METERLSETLASTNQSTRRLNPEDNHIFTVVNTSNLTHTYIHIHTYTYTHTPTHARTHKHACAYTYTHTQRRSQCWNFRPTTSRHGAALFTSTLQSYSIAAMLPWQFPSRFDFPDFVYFVSYCFSPLWQYILLPLKDIALIKEAKSTSETPANFYEITRRNNSEGRQLHTSRGENLKSHSETRHAVLFFLLFLPISDVQTLTFIHCPQSDMTRLLFFIRRISLFYKLHLCAFY
jgi:hypothetical protein